MSVRLLPAGLERQTVSGTGTVAAPAAVGGPAPPPRVAPRREESDTSWYTGFAARQAQLNQQSTGAQRALAFLDALQPRLRDLGRRLSTETALDGVPAALADSLDQIRDTWTQRHAMSGGTLDADLRHFPDGDARQRFRIRGLDRAALAHPEAETITFYPRGMGRPSRTLFLAADGSVDERLQRLDRALAPAGIRVALDDAGEPALSVLEAAWPTLRDQVLVQGGGRRFPSGWPARVTAEPDRARIAPLDWRLDGAEARRDAFRQTSAAMTVVEEVRTALLRALGDAAAAVYAEHRRPGRATLGAAAHAFAGALAGDSGYRRLATAGACLRGLSRQRVGSVLDR